MKKYTKTDRRVSKTRNAITNTLLKLMETKPITEITVSELTELADVNRKTFYNHYENIDAVLAELENNCSSWVLNFVEETPFDKMVDEPAALYTEIAMGLQRHRDLLVLLNRAGIYSRLSGKIRNGIKKAVLEKANGLFKNEYMPMLRLLLDFVTAGAVGVYDSMFENDGNATIEDITKYFSLMFSQTNFTEVVRRAMK